MDTKEPTNAELKQELETIKKQNAWSSLGDVFAILAVLCLIAYFVMR